MVLGESLEFDDENRSISESDESDDIGVFTIEEP